MTTPKASAADAGTDTAPTKSFMTRLDRETGRRVTAMALRERRSVSQAIALLVERGLKQTSESVPSGEGLHQAS